QLVDEFVAQKVFQLFVSTIILVGNFTRAGEVELGGFDFDNFVGRFRLGHWHWHSHYWRASHRLALRLVVRIANVHRGQTIGVAIRSEWIRQEAASCGCVVNRTRGNTGLSVALVYRWLCGGRVEEAGAKMRRCFG